MATAEWDDVLQAPVFELLPLLRLWRELPGTPGVEEANINATKSCNIPSSILDSFVLHWVLRPPAFHEYLFFVTPTMSDKSKHINCRRRRRSMLNSPLELGHDAHTWQACQSHRT
jgi:hypothetical protein